MPEDALHREAGVSPSAPCAHASSRSEAATARAAASQEGTPPQTPRLLDSPAENVVLTAGLGSGQLSQEDCVSKENLPPTSTPNTTNRARACLPTSSGHVASLRLLALVTLAPSSTVARVMGWPSVLKAQQTRVVSTANWAPPNKGRPSTTSSLLPSPAATAGSAKSRSRNSTLVVTRPPPSRQIRPATLSRTHPLFSRTPARAHAARWWPKESSGRPHRQIRTTPQQGDTKQLRLHPRDPALGNKRVPSQHLNHLGNAWLPRRQGSFW